MSGTDTKPRWSGTALKARFGGDTVLDFGGKFRTNNNIKGPAAGLEDAIFCVNLALEKG